jgi:hypothetical protein
MQSKEKSRTKGCRNTSAAFLCLTKEIIEDAAPQSAFRTGEKTGENSNIKNFNPCPIWV